jgi:hypothetical protein
MKNNKEYNRRRFLKNTAASTLGVSVAGYGFGTMGIDLVKADSPNETWEKSDSAKHTSGGWNTGVYHSTSVGWYGATYEDEVSAWGHDFRLSTSSAARHTEHDSSLDRIDMHYAGVNQGTTDRVDAAVSDDHHGVWPRTKDDTYDHSDLMADLAKEAISTLSTFADFALTATELASNLTPDDARVDSSDYTYLDKWDYNTEHSDVGHYRWYEVYNSGPNEDTFSIETQATDSDFGLEPKTTFTFSLYADYEPNETSTSSTSSTQATTTSAGTTLYQPKPGWLVERIPYEKISARGRALGWPERRIQRHLEKTGKPVYFAHQAPIELVE